jgi:hypothetical protein
MKLFGGVFVANPALSLVEMVHKKLGLGRSV